MTTTLQSVCPRKVPADRGPYRWPCVRAAGHDGDCKPSVEAEHVQQPLGTGPYDAEWMRQQLLVEWTRQENERLDRLTAFEGERDFLRRRTRVLRAAMDIGAGRTAQHGPLCWLRHPGCLAKVIWQVGGVDRAIADLDDAAARHATLKSGTVAGSARE